MVNQRIWYPSQFNIMHKYLMPPSNRFDSGIILTEIIITANQKPISYPRSLHREDKDCYHWGY